MTPQHDARDPLIERLVNRAIAACHRSLQLNGSAERRAVVVDPQLDAGGQRIFLGDGEVRVGVGTYEALRQLFYREGFRWTEADPARAERGARALAMLHARALQAALGGSDVPVPGAPVGSLAGHNFRNGARELFRARAHAGWLQRLGVDQVAPDVAALPCPPAYPVAAPAMNVLTGYLAERSKTPAEAVLREIVQAGGGGPERAARYAIQGYDGRLWAHVESMQPAEREAVVRRVLAPMDQVLGGRSWRRSEAPEPEAAPSAVRAAAEVHGAVLDLAEAAGLRAAARAGTSLAREKAEYGVRCAYIAWARATGPARIGALAQRVAARAALVAVAAREQGTAAALSAGRGAAAAGRAVGAGAASAGERARVLAGTAVRPLSGGVERLQASNRAGQGVRASIRRQVAEGGFGF